METLTDRTRQLAEEEGASVYLEPRKGYGRAYKTGFAMAPGDVIVTMDADCTYPGEEVPDLVRKLMQEDLQWITCDRLRRAEEGAMPGLHGFGNWVLSTTAKFLYWYGVHDSQSGMWVFRSRFSRTKEFDLAMMECLFHKNSRFVLVVTSARRIPQKSVFLTGQELERLRSILGEMGC